MKNSTTPAKMEAISNAPISTQNAPVNSPIISIEAEEVKPLKSVQDFLNNVENAKLLANQHSKFVNRISEIDTIMNNMKDNTHCTMVITHHSTKKSIEFPLVNVIYEFLSGQLERGKEELAKLETDMRNFSMS